MEQMHAVNKTIVCCRPKPHALPPARSLARCMERRCGQASTAGPAAHGSGYLHTSIAVGGVAMVLSVPISGYL